MPVTIHNRPLRVLIDPGHGGDDPGAVFGSFKEKDIALAVALKLKTTLDRFGIHNFLTRDVDKNLPLNFRANDVRIFRADLMVSIHCNSSEAPANGPESICRTGSPESYRLARDIHGFVATVLPGAKNRGVKQSPSPDYPRTLYLLKNIQCPGALIELDFINTRGRELSEFRYQNDFAAAIANGIVKFSKTL